MLGFFSLTLFVSATLLFFVQPMIGKMILPILGGTPAVWNTCMVFFQAMLLVGYAYTHTLSTTQPRRRQLLVQGVLLLLPLIVLPFALGDRAPPTEENPIFWLLWLLLGMVGLPFFVVSTTAPLLQKWFATTGHSAAKDPYFLYGASNFGSMLGLLAYPALIEWMWDVPMQAVVWTVCYALFIALVLGCAYLVWKTPEPALVTVPVAMESPALVKEPPVLAPALATVSTAVTTSRRRGARLSAAPAPAVKPALRQLSPSFWQSLAWLFLAKDETVPRRADDITMARRIRWVLLAAVPSSLMLGVTTHLTIDIAAVPSFWVVPLELYLLTFILVFARWPVVWTGTPHTVVLYLQPVFLFFLVLRLIVPSISWPPLWFMPPPTACEFTLHLLAFFGTALMCHGELARDRPGTRHLTEFFLWMSVGGVLGGLFNALFAPVALRYGMSYGLIEYPAAMVVAGLIRPYMTQDITQAQHLAVPRRVADAPLLLLDVLLLLLGMTTYSAGTIPPAQRRGVGAAVVAFLRRCWPSSNLLEILLDLCVPIAYGGFVYKMLEFTERKFYGITITRPYLMAGAVVLALAMAMRPIRFGLSLAALFLVIGVYDRYDRRTYESWVFEDRGFFGYMRVREIKESEPGDDGAVRLARVRRTLIHGGINHGQQLVWPEPLRREPITYFHPTNGIGELFHKLTWGNPPGKAHTPEHDAWMQANMWTDPPKQREGEDSRAWQERTEKWYDAFIKTRGRFYPADARMPASLVGLGAVSPWAQLVGTQQQPPYAVIGLGTGTLAAHAQPFQHVDFYEIDPIVRRLSVPPSGDAEDLIFYYVDDALHRGARLDIVMGDGRLKIKEAPANYYHAILLDAFSSDAVPVHLLTKEAVEVYLNKLADGGVLIFNTTNRYVQIPPVLARIAEELNPPLECLWCPDYGNDRMPEKYGADWVALRRRGTFSNGGPPLHDRLHVSDDRWQRPQPYPGRAWTDSYSNLLSVMRW